MPLLSEQTQEECEAEGLALEADRLQADREFAWLYTQQLIATDSPIENIETSAPLPLGPYRRARQRK